MANVQLHAKAESTNKKNRQNLRDSDKKKKSEKDFLHTHQKNMDQKRFKERS